MHPSNHYISLEKYKSGNCRRELVVILRHSRSHSRTLGNTSYRSLVLQNSSECIILSAEFTAPCWLDRLVVDRENMVEEEYQAEPRSDAENIAAKDHSALSRTLATENYCITRETIIHHMKTSSRESLCIYPSQAIGKLSCATRELGTSGSHLHCLVSRYSMLCFACFIGNHCWSAGSRMIAKSRSDVENFAAEHQPDISIEHPVNEVEWSDRRC